MGKISPVSAKYIIQATINIDGVVDRPDVIGSVFGQTEGLLGNDLELRELQRSGRIGRIEVDLETQGGKTKGVIVIPSSLDKTETVLIAAAVETIQRIGPCNSHVTVDKVEDVRISKRIQVVERARELLSKLTFTTLPDSRDIKDQVSDSVKVMEVVEYGKERIPAGPMINEAEELIVVEGRADVLNLLKHDIKNCIALGGTNIPETIINLSRKKTITVFVDGDRGGDLIIRALSSVAEIDYVCKAPDGKEVEELTQKEIHKALRGKIAMEQVKMEIDGKSESLANYNNRANNNYENKPNNNYERKSAPPVREEREYNRRPQQRDNRDTRGRIPYRNDRNNERRPYTRGGNTYDNRERGEGNYTERSSPGDLRLSTALRGTFKKMLDDLLGTRGAYILDNENNILGKVPVLEITSTLTSLTSGVHAIILDGTVTQDVVQSADVANVEYLVGKDSTAGRSGKVKVITAKDL